MMQHADFANKIPHTGAMCLLDEILEHRDDFILARACELMEENPLLVDGRFCAEICIEYAAQAAAVHAALGGQNLSDGKPAFLASAKRCSWQSERVKTQIATLDLHVTMMASFDMGVSYEFHAYADDTLWVDGSLLLMKVGVE